MINFLKMSKIATIFPLFFLAVFLFPVSSHAVKYIGSDDPKEKDFQLVPCDGVDVPCDFNALMLLFNRVINFIFYISIPLAAISFSWAGYLYLSAAGNTSQIEKAHGIFKTVLIGFIFIISAWLIVYTITHTLLSDEFLNSQDNFLQDTGDTEGEVGSGGGVSEENRNDNVGANNRDVTDVSDLQFDFGD